MAQNFLPEHRISIAVAASARAAGQTAINGAALDMQGYEGAVAIIEMGTIAATAVTSIKWQQSDTTTSADFSDLEGTGIDVADDDDDKIFVSELYRPTKRYVRIVVARATANAAVRAATYIQYKARSAPVTQGTDVTTELSVGPTEGTA